MAECIHGNVIDQCGLCRIDSHKAIYDNFEGQIATTHKPKGSSRPDLAEALEGVDHQAEKEKQDEIMKEYIKNSFTTKLEEEDNKEE